MEQLEENIKNAGMDMNEYLLRKNLVEAIDERDELRKRLAESEQKSHQVIFDLYHELKEKIGELGYNNFIHSKEVEEYREWLRNDKYKHRLEWFEKKFPNGLYYKDEDGHEIGVRLITKQFLAESDAAYEHPETPTP
jgi:hypothetical protein